MVLESCCRLVVVRHANSMSLKDTEGNARCCLNITSDARRDFYLEAELCNRAELKKIKEHKSCFPFC